MDEKYILIKIIVLHAQVLKNKQNIIRISRHRLGEQLIYVESIH